MPNPNQYKYVNHKDLNKKNNNVSNLEWCTQLHNMRDAANKGTFLEISHSVQIVETGKIYRSINDCARDINAEPKNISACLLGKRKRCKGYHFKKVDTVNN